MMLEPKTARSVLPRSFRVSCQASASGEMVMIFLMFAFLATTKEAHRLRVSRSASLIPVMMMMRSSSVEFSCSIMETDEIGDRSTPRPVSTWES